MEGLLTTLLTSAATAALTVWVADRKARVDEKLARLKGEMDGELAKTRASFDREIAEQKARLDQRALYAAERVAHDLLMTSSSADDSEQTTRTFRIIKSRIRGFSDDDLRQILVRAGAISMVGPCGEERWGLLERNRDFLRGTRESWMKHALVDLPVSAESDSSVLQLVPSPQSDEAR